MKVTETYLKNKKEIEKFLNTFSFDAESEARIRAYIDNPLSVVNDDIKRMFEKFDGDNEIVDYRIPLPASIMKQRKKYQKEIYLIMATVVNCLVEDDQFTFTVDANGNISMKANNKPQTNREFIIEMLEADNYARRIVIPNGAVTGLGDIVYKDDQAIGYPITITANLDSSGNTHYEYVQQHA